MNVIADTCFWISLCDPQEGNHDEVVCMMDKIKMDRHIRLLVPHPVLYETLCTRMVRRPDLVQSLTKYFKDTEKIGDGDYIDTAYQVIAEQAANRNGDASMVDVVIMLMSEDPKNQIKGILTANRRDFALFCQKHSIPMLDTLAVLNAY